MEATVRVCFWWAVTVWTFLTTLTNGLPACDSDIWCKGPLLEAVQNARLYPDSKTFVDMSITTSPDVVTSAYANLSSSGTRTPTRAQLREFIDDYFEGPDTEFEKWTPDDYTESPAFLNNIKDEKLKEFGKFLCKTWSHLGRKIKRQVSNNQDRYSLIYLEKPFIIPGGRFRETYYWDSYWVIKGLLTCEMYQTAKGMLQNFMSLIERYGMVPNGNRVYYTRRSQPPMLIPMVDLYMEATNDTAFLHEIVPSLAEEYKFWMTNRSVRFDDGMILNIYNAPIDTPRPESYTEDQITQRLQTDRDIYQDLASAAESGWDFSSRWFSEDFQEFSDHTKWLGYTDTNNILPVDLNSILCWNEKLMAKFYDIIGENNASTHYTNRHKQRVEQMDGLFWDNTTGAWFDHFVSDRKSRKRFFPSNVFPLFVGCYNGSKRNVEERILEYLVNVQAINFTSGIPTSLLETGQQWDYPNVWPPLEHMIITSLADSTNTELQDMAQRLAQHWIQSNYVGWMKTHRMFEKYVATAMGSRGHGGEYDVQEGFGWTNGVALDLLNRFGQSLTIESVKVSDGSNDAAKNVMTSSSSIFVILCYVIVANLFSDVF